MCFPSTLQHARQAIQLVSTYHATSSPVMPRSTHSCMLQVRKTSRRDLPAVAAQRCDGATTVSATMLLAARVGIAVFVTGGVMNARDIWS